MKWSAVKMIVNEWYLDTNKNEKKDEKEGKYKVTAKRKKKMLRRRARYVLAYNSITLIEGFAV